MAFSKQPKACQDSAVGFQRINALNTNLVSLKGELELEHVPLANVETTIAGGSGTFGLPRSAPSFDGFDLAAGRHDLSQIPRGTAVVETLSTGVRLKAGTGAIGSMLRVDVGVYFFPMAGFVKVWGKATPRVGSNVRIPVDARVYPTVNGPGLGLVVRTFLRKNNGTNDEMLPHDTGFFLVAWGARYGVATTVPPPRLALLSGRPRFSQGPMVFWPSRLR